MVKGNRDCFIFNSSTIRIRAKQNSNNMMVLDNKLVRSKKLWEQKIHTKLNMEAYETKSKDEGKENDIFNMTSEFTGFDMFPNGRLRGKLQCQHTPFGIISWQFDGIFTTYKNDIAVVSCNGRTIKVDLKKIKYTGVATFITDSEKLSWLNEIVTIVEGQGDSNFREITGTGYRWE